ncbi:efflux RND transporter permease subunit [Allohahella marinimesophila]|uniref:Multidrug efflux RND transporter permease subunit VmeK n=1 Tax=Allohahella marinimesophila TaxID=1054972 RepID=A0ABP7NJG6_9GAMM
MNALIDAAFSRGRTVIMLFVIILGAGAVAYFGIPKESEPDIPIPTIYVSVTHEGISPGDAERLLAKPLEKELQTLEGLKEMRATAAEGYASVTLEFDAGFDADKALQDVREKVDLAKVELPSDSDEPRVTEINTALFPVLTVVLSGQVPERTLVTLARDLKDKVESLAGVLEVDIGGDREEVLEIIANPSVMETYNISYNDVFTLVQRNNRLVAAGALDTGAGRMVLKVPGLIEDLEDVLSLPIKVSGNTVVTFRDVADIRRTFKDPDSFARVGGEPALVLEISKRSGANIIETIAEIRALIASEQLAWPEGLSVSFLQDKSEQIKTMLGDLENNVITAVVLVMIVIVAALGGRPAILVGLAIPGSFLAGMLVLDAMGITLNIVVLFSLILVVGMLVDGAIVTTELADRRMAEGADRKEAYAFAAKRMAWPIISSTATTLAVFIPLVFWPGIVGEFMKFLPITVLITLAASIAMALIFIPVLGGMIARPMDSRDLKSGDPVEDARGFTRRYLNVVATLLRHPAKTLVTAILITVGTYVAYGSFGRGVEFFPSTEPDFAQVQVQARGDLSVLERDALVRQVESRLLEVPELKTVYARTIGGGAQGGQNRTADTVGVIQIEFIDWSVRDPAEVIIPRLRELVADIPGIVIQVREQESGPSGGKPVQMEVSARDPALLEASVVKLRGLLDELGGFEDIADNRALPSIEWQLHVDRAKAALYGADVALLGDAVKMLTTGIQLAEYRPDDTDDAVDIRLRFPLDERNLERIKQLRVPTADGQIPVSNFLTLQPAQKTGALSRTDGRRVMTIEADVAPDLLPDQQVQRIRAALADVGLDPAVQVTFKGQDEDQRETSAFLGTAFLTAMFLMITILVTQFNSFYQTALVLSAIVFSTAGVLLGLMVMGQPFGIVMGGIGVIALAGIVVNNNIVLIDTFNDLRKAGMAAREAIMQTVAERMRPVLLTSVTTVLGLLPMVFAMNIDLIGQNISFGAPSTQWWVQLSSAIAGGLTLATMLTLLLTPCLLMLGENVSAARARRREQRERSRLALQQDQA